MSIICTNEFASFINSGKPQLTSNAILVWAYIPHALHPQAIKMANLLLAVCALEAFLAAKVAQSDPAFAVQPTQSLE